MKYNNLRAYYTQLSGLYKLVRQEDAELYKKVQKQKDYVDYIKSIDLSKYEKVERFKEAEKKRLRLEAAELDYKAAIEDYKKDSSELYRQYERMISNCVEDINGAIKTYLSASPSDYNAELIEALKSGIFNADEIENIVMENRHNMTMLRAIKNYVKDFDDRDMRQINHNVGRMLSGADEMQMLGIIKQYGDRLFDKKDIGKYAATCKIWDMGLIDKAVDSISDYPMFEVDAE